MKLVKKFLNPAESILYNKDSTSHVNINNLIFNLDFDLARANAADELRNKFGIIVHWDDDTQTLRDALGNTYDTQASSIGDGLEYILTGPTGGKKILNPTFGTSNPATSFHINGRNLLIPRSTVSKSSGEWIRDGLHNISEGLGWIADRAGEILSIPFLSAAELGYLYDTAGPSSVARAAGALPPAHIANSTQEMLEETMPVAGSFMSFMSPSHVIDWALGNGAPYNNSGIFGDTGAGRFGNFIFDIAAYSRGPLIIRGATNKGINFLRNNVTIDKPFIRNIGVVPEVEDGMFWLSPEHDAFTNVTWDKSFRTHSHYKSRPGAEYLVINPRAFNGRRFLSTDPMDTFTPNFRISVDDVTFVSGNPETRALAESRGFKTLSSDYVDEAYGKINFDDPDDGLGGIRFSKYEPFRSKEAKAYDDAVNKLISSIYGSPTIWDAWKLRLKTGINPHAGTFRFKYHPSSPIEYKLGKKYDFSPHPAALDFTPGKFQYILDDLGSRTFFQNNNSGYPQTTSFLYRPYDLLNTALTTEGTYAPYSSDSFNYNLNDSRISFKLTYSGGNKASTLMKYDVLLDGKEIGSVNFRLNHKNKTIDIAFVNINQKGYGLSVYRNIAKKFPGYTLLSDTWSLSQDAINMWERLVKKGLAIKRGDKDYYLIFDK